LPPTYQDAIYRIRNNTPDIILCDYMLGDGRSGQQMLEELRRFNLLPDETIFMMVTGEQSYEQVVSAVELVPDDYIIKPFSPDKLMSASRPHRRQEKLLRQVLQGKAPAGIRQGAGHAQAQRDSEAGRPYRFEILRQQAEVLLASGDAKSAEVSLPQHSRQLRISLGAGRRRPLAAQAEPAERRRARRSTAWSAGTPHFFDAADLKASICMAQGEHEEAQQCSTRWPRKRRATTCASACWPRPQP
jgi:DNA-binding response OmpR family regulator